MKAALALAGLLALAAPAGWALTLDLPAKAELRAEKSSVLGSYRFPVGPWKDGGFQAKRAEGPVLIRAWRVDQRDLTTLQVMADLRAQLETKRFTPLYECDTRACGGFDFRYHLQILPEPQMHVDLGDFRYLVTRRQADTGPQYVGLLVSRSAESRFVEVIRVGLPLPAAAKATAAKQSPPDAGPPPAAIPAPPPQDVAAGLAAGVAVPLDDLDFSSGSSDLAPGEYGSLRTIADYMKAHPDQHITLVGHTDTTGGLEPNLALSKKRAESVRDRLIKDYGVDPKKIAAAGVGYLAPRASNDTKAGRERNRRVEAMVDSGQ
ncbi:membrane protein [Defluviimonas sp. 20V17]|uniref:Membrane protein n=1 Tax=Allgaiera indica TaxID=765699 RepID=A0AAN4ZX68_9RHOB|nr:OmpA family protein [Allgaiera indica]KDB03570.1 membrane protein [Defluviimonas sp. 20V17]GHD98370.1 membrane protein [Allgaiera indica]SDW48580.1 OmpA-OmpF porin, OOP family [Allgaiera indica]